MTSYSPAEQTEKLSRLIQEEIHQNNGAISFARFMELALYSPDLGYYNAPTRKLGKDGDFVTAPEITPFFSRCIATQCQQIFQEIDKSSMLEFGAGTGIFARDILLEFEKRNCLPEHYYIIEISPELRIRQQELLQQSCPYLLPKVKWLEKLPENFSGVYFANEVMDAMPPHLFTMTEEGIKERCVTWNGSQFAWCLTPPSDQLLQAVANLQISFPVGYESEIHLQLPAWLTSLAKSLKQGVILLIDYGYGRAEYYRPDRMQGTLMSFYQHQAIHDPLLRPGLQDITAHIDFTAVIENAFDAGLTLGGYTTQSAFLLALGLLDLAKPSSSLETHQQNLAIKQLTLPSQMGEIVKVMALNKGINTALRGFEQHSRIQDL